MVGIMYNRDLLQWTEAEGASEGCLWGEKWYVLCDEVMEEDHEVACRRFCSSHLFIHRSHIPLHVNVMLILN